MKTHLAIIWLASFCSVSLVGCCSRPGASTAVIAPIGSWQTTNGPSRATLTLQKNGTFILRREMHGKYEMPDSNHIRIDLVTSNGTQSISFPFSATGGELTLGPVAPRFSSVPLALKFQRVPESVFEPIGSWQSTDDRRWTLQEDGTFISDIELCGKYRVLDPSHIRIVYLQRNGKKSQVTNLFSVSGGELTLTFQMMGYQEATKFQRAPD